jgi:hypothetical protein
MNNPFGRAQNRFQRQDRSRDPDRDENRSAWQGREERDEDGGWGRNREDEWSRNHGLDRSNEPAFGSDWSGSEGQGQRGYGRGIYGESGLGEPNRDERWRPGSNPRPGYAPVGANDYRQSASRYGSGYGSREYGYGSRGYSPTGLDRDRFGSQPDQGFRGRDFGGGGFAGRGPKDYKRTDERIREDVCDRLSQDDEVDASDISVRVGDGEVTLEGSTETRRQKHRAEEIAADVSGVNDVHNNVRVRKSVMNELKDKLTGQDEVTGGHAGSGTKNAASSFAEHNNH